MSLYLQQVDMLQHAFVGLADVIIDEFCECPGWMLGGFSRITRLGQTACRAIT